MKKKSIMIGKKKTIMSALSFAFLFIIAVVVQGQEDALGEETQTSTQKFIFDNLALYLIIIFGIFSFMAYLVVTYIIYRAQGFFGPWIIFSIVSLLFLFAEFTVGNIVLHRRFVAGIMFLFFFAALFRYWDAIEIGQ